MSLFFFKFTKSEFAISILWFALGSAIYFPASKLQAEPIKQDLTLCGELNHSSPLIKSVTEQINAFFNHIAAKSNITIHIVKAPWKRCVGQARTGQVDGLYPVIWSQARSEFLEFPENSHQNQNNRRLLTMRYYFYENVNQPLDFENVRFGIGTPIGYVAEQQLKERGLLSPITYSANEGLRMVSLGKLDAYVVSDVVGTAIVDALGISDLVQKREPPFVITDLHVPFSKKVFKEKRATIELFWNTMAQERSLFTDQ